MINLNSSTYYQIQPEKALTQHIEEALDIARQNHNFVFVFVESAPVPEFIVETA